jgi:DNA transformation protein
MNDAPLHALPGIGPVTQTWLNDIGVKTLDELRCLGSVETYRRLKFMRPNRVSLNALYALEAVLRGCHWLHLPPLVKAALQEEAKAIDLASRKGASARCTLP